MYPAFPVGINNTASEENMPRDQWGNVVALRDAVNIDIPPDGKPRRREGYTRAAPATLAHSAWSDDYLPFGLFADGANLCAFNEDGSVDVLRSDLAAGLPVSYARINDEVWWSSRAGCGVVTVGLGQRRWALLTPPAPTLAASTGGALHAGTYQVTLTYLDADGRESGAPRAALVQVPEGGVIHVNNLPSTAGVDRVRVYCTHGQDGVLRAALTVPAGTAAVDITLPPEGRVCDTQFLAPMPPGQLVAHGNGRMFVARGHEVLFSPALRYGLFNPSAGRVGFVGRIQMMAFVGDGTDGAGLYVSDSKRVYWLAGKRPEDWAQQIASGHAALPGSLAWVSADVFGLATSQRVPCWHSRSGRLCVGLPGGEVHTPQPRPGVPDAAWDVGEAAALHFIERPGDRRLISALRGAQPSHLAVGDTLTVREYRHSTP